MHDMVTATNLLVLTAGILFIVCLVEGLHRLALVVAVLLVSILLLPQVLAMDVPPVTQTRDSDTKMTGDFETGFTVICGRRIGGKYGKCTAS